MSGNPFCQVSTANSNKVDPTGQGRTCINPWHNEVAAAPRKRPKLEFSQPLSIVPQMPVVMPIRQQQDGWQSFPNQVPQGTVTQGQVPQWQPAPAPASIPLPPAVPQPVTLEHAFADWLGCAQKMFALEDIKQTVRRVLDLPAAAATRGGSSGSIAPRTIPSPAIRGVPAHISSHRGQSNRSVKTGGDQLPGGPWDSESEYAASVAADFPIVSVRAGQTFTKAWKVKNIGSVPWPFCTKVSCVHAS